MIMQQTSWFRRFLPTSRIALARTAGLVLVTVAVLSVAYVYLYRSAPVQSQPVRPPLSKPTALVHEVSFLPPKAVVPTIPPVVERAAIDPTKLKAIAAFIISLVGAYCIYALYSTTDVLPARVPAPRAGAGQPLVPNRPPAAPVQAPYSEGPKVSEPAPADNLTSASSAAGSEGGAALPKENAGSDPTGSDSLCLNFDSKNNVIRDHCASKQHGVASATVMDLQRRRRGVFRQDEADMLVDRFRRTPEGPRHTTPPPVTTTMATTSITPPPVNVKPQSSIAATELVPTLTTLFSPALATLFSPALAALKFGGQKALHFIFDRGRDGMELFAELGPRMFPLATDYFSKLWKHVPEDIIWKHVPEDVKYLIKDLPLTYITAEEVSAVYTLQRAEPDARNQIFLVARKYPPVHLNSQEQELLNSRPLQKKFNALVEDFSARIQLCRKMALLVRYHAYRTEGKDVEPPVFNEDDWPNLQRHRTLDLLFEKAHVIRSDIDTPRITYDESSTTFFCDFAPADMDGSVYVHEPTLPW